MSKPLQRALLILLLVVLLFALAFMVPSPAPLALGEDAPVYPAYEPVELTGGDVQPVPYLSETPWAPHESGWLPDGAGYLDPTLSVRVSSTRAYDTDIQLVWVQVADGSQIRTELAKPYPSKSELLGIRMAEKVNAVFALVGDSFIRISQGFIMRNGEVLREKYSDTMDSLMIDDHGDFHIVQSVTKEKIDDVRADYNIVHAFSFGPALVVEGAKCESCTFKGCAPTVLAQRIAIAQMDDRSYLIVATEGPENKGSKGLNIKDFAQLLYDLGAYNAYNLDGGSSSTVVLNNKKINALSTHKQRKINDIIYFITAAPEN